MLKRMIALAALVAITAFAAPAFAEPVEQRGFQTFVQNYRDRFVASSNDLVKGDLVTLRARDLRYVMKDERAFKDWEMFVLSVNRDKNGLVWLALISNLSQTPDYMLVNMPVADDDRFDLALPNALFNVARTLDVGDRVIVSGSLELDDRAGYFDYGLAIAKNVADSMTRPMFAARFSAIEKVEPVKPVRQPTPLVRAPSSTSTPLR